jgi:hypothetical protein
MSALPPKADIDRSPVPPLPKPRLLNYAQIKTDKGKGERWFCAEEEAHINI